MSTSIGTFEIGLDTPIHMLTPRQLFEMQEAWMAKVKVSQPKQEAKPKRWYVNKISELAKILGTSVATVYRMKSDGLLDSAISQYGKWMVIDVDKVLEIFKLSNKRKTKK